MNPETINTATTAGKAKVMQLASEGRDVAERTTPVGKWSAISFPLWDRRKYDYAIIVAPVEPEEVWIATTMGSALDGCCFETSSEAAEHAGEFGGELVRYIRADLAGRDG